MPETLTGTEAIYGVLDKDLATSDDGIADSAEVYETASTWCGIFAKPTV